MRELTSDIRFTLRQIRRHPGFASLLILTLGLGIGATTAMFSVVSGVLSPELPYAEADRLVLVSETRGDTRISVAYPNFVDWRERSRAFEDLAAAQFGTYTMTSAGDAMRVRVYRSSAELFATLGVRPLLGRGFLPEEDAPGGAAVAVLSHAFWQSAFGADSGVVGRDVRLDGERYTVVGVMPPRVDFFVNGELWVPIGRLVPGSELEDRTAHGGTRVVGRLAPGVGVDEARREMDDIAGALAAEYPTTNADAGVHLVTLRDYLVGDVRPVAALLFGAVGFLLLISCFNAANLLSARVSARGADLAMRAALGAGRLRLARQLLTESVVIAVAAGAAGVLLSVALVKLVVALDPGWLPRYADVGIDASVLAFATLVSVAVGVFFGAAPIAQTSTRAVERQLKGGRSGGSDLPRWGRFRRSLVLLQVALSLVLLTGAGLMARSLVELTTVDVGFEPRDALVFDVGRPPALEAERSRTTTAGLYRRILDRIEALPGVVAAGVANPLPLSGRDRNRHFWIEGMSYAGPDDLVRVDYAPVSPGYFDAMGIPLLRGRNFDRTDTGEPSVVLVDETFAERFWTGRDPIGRRIKGGAPDSDSPELTVVGVVGSVRHYGVDAEPRPQVYFSFAQAPLSGTFVVRTTGEPESYIPLVRSAVAAVDEDAPVDRVRTLDDMYSASIARPRFSAFVLGAFSVLALALATLGVYGLMAYDVAQRTSEIGVRMALGARRVDVWSGTVGRAVLPVAGGLAAGTLASLALTRFLSSQVHDVSTTDPATFLGAAFVLATAALLGCAIPASRAARTQPVDALRPE